MQKWKDRIGVELNVVSAREKIISALGGGVAIIILIVICQECLSGMSAAGCLAPMAASAVLLFAVPHGQLSQPWPVIAGHTMAALIGVLCHLYIPQVYLAGAVALAASILMMHLLKCIHPPGGATALIAAMGGPAIHELGFQFVLMPVLLNAVIMVILAIAINSFFPWRRYPAFLIPKPKPEVDDVTHEEIIQALRSLDSFVDVTEEDLIRLHQLFTHPKSGLAGKRRVKRRVARDMVSAGK